MEPWIVSDLDCTVKMSSPASFPTRKPYTVTKQREWWTDDEHDRFQEALKLYGRAWQRIEEHIGTKTAVQIRSHAHKFFTKARIDLLHDEISTVGKEVVALKGISFFSGPISGRTNCQAFQKFIKEGNLFKQLQVRSASKMRKIFGLD
ncbi:unnamed protein product [Arabis nemorensis]|uniref:Uncharacterized protein n=1 Tax=Arabis nemorensis TaxID=586526 RepID=A0A565CNW8_9BRAS|nr:unnamed protein product [Arabis nemorensis]